MTLITQVAAIINFAILLEEAINLLMESCGFAAFQCLFPLTSHRMIYSIHHQCQNAW